MQDDNESRSTEARHHRPGSRDPRTERNRSSWRARSVPVFHRDSSMVRNVSQQELMSILEQKEQKVADRERAGKNPNRLMIDHEVAEVRKLIRERHAIDLSIWSRRDSLATHRSEIMKDCEQSDEILGKIRWIVHRWDRTTFSSEEWVVANKLRSVLLGAMLDQSTVISTFEGQARDSGYGSRVDSREVTRQPSPTRQLKQRPFSEEDFMLLVQRIRAFSDRFGSDGTRVLPAEMAVAEPITIPAEEETPFATSTLSPVGHQAEGSAATLGHPSFDAYENAWRQSFRSSSFKLDRDANRSTVVNKSDVGTEITGTRRTSDAGRAAPSSSPFETATLPHDGDPLGRNFDAENTFDAAPGVKTVLLPQAVSDLGSKDDPEEHNPFLSRGVSEGSKHNVSDAGAAVQRGGPASLIALRRDWSAMKIITVLMILYMVGTIIATLMDTPLFYRDRAESGFESEPLTLLIALRAVALFLSPGILGPTLGIVVFLLLTNCETVDYLTPKSRSLDTRVSSGQYTEREKIYQRRVCDVNTKRTAGSGVFPNSVDVRSMIDMLEYFSQRSRIFAVLFLAIILLPPAYCFKRFGAVFTWLWPVFIFSVTLAASRTWVRRHEMRSLDITWDQVEAAKASDAQLLQTYRWLHLRLAAKRALFHVPTRAWHSTRTMTLENLKRALRPRIEHNNTRLEWKCTCGQAMYGDYRGRRLDLLLRQLQCLGTNHGDISMPLRNQNRNFASAEKKTATFVPEEGLPANPTDFSTTDSPQHNSPFSSAQGPLRSSADLQLSKTSSRTSLSLPSSASAPIQSFLELCINRNKYLTRIGEIELVNVRGEFNVTSDFDLFAKIRKQYDNLGRRGTLGYLYRPRDVRFVHFGIRRGVNQAGIYNKEQDEIPPAEEVREGRYHYYECPLPQMPPMDRRTFFHYFWDHASHAPTNDMTFHDRLPKKLGCSILVASRSTPLTMGWGVHIIEGPNWPVFPWIVVGLLTVTLVVCAVYDSVFKGQESGFTIGQLIFSVFMAVLSSIISHVIDTV